MTGALKKHWKGYFFVFPSLIFILLFSYFPIWTAVVHSFYIWDGANLRIFTGIENFTRAIGDPAVHYGFGVIAILIFANLFKMIPSIAAAVAIHRLKSEKAGYIYRVLFVVPMIIPAMVTLLIWKYFFDPHLGILNAMLDHFFMLDFMQWVDGIFGWGVFIEGVRPAWLAREELIVPALIIMGFPWVGVISVLIYLAGLSSISSDIYDAARLDGVGPFGLFKNVELPLIMTQVRLNLILMIISTLQEFGLVLVLLGDSGGPGGAGMLPGLYMFRKAFLDQEVGYACAIGMIIFLIIGILTYINQKYVRVDK